MKARASGEGGICHPLHAVRPPAPGTGACGISAGPKRRAARMRTKTPLQNRALARDRRGIRGGRRLFVPTRGDKDPDLQGFRRERRDSNPRPPA